MPRAKSRSRRTSGKRAAITDIGFVGLGMMGLPMAANLLTGDSVVRLHVPAGRSKAHLRKLQPTSRITRHKSLPELAAAVQVCFTMLPMPEDVEQVILDPRHGLIAGLKRGSVVVDCTTSSARLAREIDGQLSKMGAAGVDSPVSGSPMRAKSGTLSLMVGGRKAAFKRVRPILEQLGTPTYMGPVGTGQITKSINQMIVGLVMAAIGEGIILGRSAGIDLEAMLQAVGGGLAGTEVMRIKGPDMIRERFEPGAYLRYHLKDLNLALETAAENGLALPFTSLTREVYRMGVAMGRDRIDHSGIMTVLETMNGIEVPKRYAGGK